MRALRRARGGCGAVAAAQRRRSATVALGNQPPPPPRMQGLSLHLQERDPTARHWRWPEALADDGAHAESRATHWECRALWRACTRWRSFVLLPGFKLGTAARLSFRSASAIVSDPGSQSLRLVATGRWRLRGRRRPPVALWQPAIRRMRTLAAATLCASCGSRARRPSRRTGARRFRMPHVGRHDALRRDQEAPQRRGVALPTVLNGGAAGRRLAWPSPTATPAALHSAGLTTCSRAWRNGRSQTRSSASSSSGCATRVRGSLRRRLAPAVVVQPAASQHHLVDRCSCCP